MPHARLLERLTPQELLIRCRRTMLAAPALVPLSMAAVFGLLARWLPPRRTYDPPVVRQLHRHHRDQAGTPQDGLPHGEPDRLPRVRRSVHAHDHPRQPLRRLLGHRPLLQSLSRRYHHRAAGGLRRPGTFGSTCAPTDRPRTFSRTEGTRKSLRRERAQRGGARLGRLGGKLLGAQLTSFPGR